jgi:hypothetical membrane protein
VWQAAAAERTTVSDVIKWGRWTAGLLPVTLVLAVLGFGAVLPGYSQWQHPVALLGAHGVAHAQAFSVLGLVLPGLLAVATALAGMSVASGRLQRIGLQLVLLSGLAFSGLGLDGPASQWHATAWLLWVVAFVPGAGLLGMGLLRAAGNQRLAIVCLLAALLVGWLSLLPGGAGLPPPLAQRLALLAWALWWPLLMWLRRA